MSQTDLEKLINLAATFYKGNNPLTALAVAIMARETDPNIGIEEVIGLFLTNKPISENRQEEITDIVSTMITRAPAIELGNIIKRITLPIIYMHSLSSMPKDYLHFDSLCSIGNSKRDIYHLAVPLGIFTGLSLNKEFYTLNDKENTRKLSKLADTMTEFLWAMKATRFPDSNEEKIAYSSALATSINTLITNNDGKKLSTRIMSRVDKLMVTANNHYIENQFIRYRDEYKRYIVNFVIYQFANSILQTLPSQKQIRRLIRPSAS